MGNVVRSKSHVCSNVCSSLFTIRFYVFSISIFEICIHFLVLDFYTYIYIIISVSIVCNRFLLIQKQFIWLKLSIVIDILILCIPVSVEQFLYFICYNKLHFYVCTRNCFDISVSNLLSWTINSTIQLIV